MGESGAEAVDPALDEGAGISAANWAEVLSRLAERGGNPEGIARRSEREGVLGEGLIFCPLDEARALWIARLRPLTRETGLSLGDRACLALAGSLGLPALTTDRAWTALDVGTEVKLIR